MKRFLLAALLLPLLLLTTTAGIAGPSPHSGRDSLVQFSTIDALLSGLYDGVISIAELKHYGDLGIGTFNALDGEMVILDGTVYRVSADGRAAVVADSDSSPFASLTFFTADQTLAVPSGTDLTSLPALVTASGCSANLFHAFVLNGHFKTVRTRSVPAQRPPYRPLVEVVKEQPLFSFDNVAGTLVGFYCPPFVSGVNVPGYHLHFLNAERNAGGHVLAFEVQNGSLAIDTIDHFSLQLPRSTAFADAALDKNRHAELEKVEK